MDVIFGVKVLLIGICYYCMDGMLLLWTWQGYMGDERFKKMCG